MSHAAMAANSKSSLTSLSFNLLFSFMPDTQINRSSSNALCNIVLHDAIEKGMPLSFAKTLARFTVAADAIFIVHVNEAYSKNLQSSFCLSGCTRPEVTNPGNTLP